jgi:hypothetical protein
LDGRLKLRKNNSMIAVSNEFHVTHTNIIQTSVTHDVVDHRLVLAGSVSPFGTPLLEGRQMITVQVLQ